MKKISSKEELAALRLMASEANEVCCAYHWSASRVLMFIIDSSSEVTLIRQVSYGEVVGKWKLRDGNPDLLTPEGQGFCNSIIGSRTMSYGAEDIETKEKVRNYTPHTNVTKSRRVQVVMQTGQVLVFNSQKEFIEYFHVSNGSATRWFGHYTNTYTKYGISSLQYIDPPTRRDGNR